MRDAKRGKALIDCAEREKTKISGFLLFWFFSYNFPKSVKIQKTLNKKIELVMYAVQQKPSEKKKEGVLRSGGAQLGGDRREW